MVDRILKQRFGVKNDTIDININCYNDLKESVSKNFNLSQNSKKNISQLDYNNLYQKLPLFISNVIKLKDNGATIHFIARYRKEMIGNLDEDFVRFVFEEDDRIINLNKRKISILTILKENKILTTELINLIIACEHLNDLEDIYSPYKKKNKTKYDIACDLGLKEFAESLLKQDFIEINIIDLAKKEFDKINNNEKKSDVDFSILKDYNDILEYSSYIIEKKISENDKILSNFLNLFLRTGEFNVSINENIEKDYSKYKDFDTFCEDIAKISSHRYLAMNRGKKEGILTVRIKYDSNKAKKLIIENIICEKLKRDFLSKNISKNNKRYYDYLIDCCNNAYKKIYQKIKSQVIRNLDEKAENDAINNFSRNLYNLLMTRPFKTNSLLAIDPGIRTGSKYAVLNGNGDVLDFGLFFINDSLKKQILELNKKFDFEIIVIGNGTGSYEFEDFLINNFDYSYLIVNESGASVYSASNIAKEELPEMNLEYRGAVSIGRRVIDPLSEFVKIDPKSLGVGMYQHDVNEKKLMSELIFIIEKVVNSVGIDLNTASYHLLKYVSGLNLRTAKKIVKYREKVGSFKNRFDLKKICKLNDLEFEQCAGFLRINNGSNFLDNTIIHPEDYELALKIKRDGANSVDCSKEKIEFILENLNKDYLDPRESFDKPILRKGKKTIDDLKVDEILEGTVKNVCDFGAFVDLGIKTDGLVHKSEILEKGYCKDVFQYLSIGQRIKVRIIKIEKDSKRISLSVKGLL